MLDGAVDKNGDVRRAAAKIHQRHADFPFLVGQHGLGRGQGFQSDVRHFHFAAVAGTHDILRRGHGPGHDVHLHFQTHARHAQRIGNAALIVHNIFLRQNVDHFAVGGNIDGPGRIQRPVNIALRHFAAADGNDAVAVDAVDMAAGNAHVDGVNLAAGHEFGSLNGRTDGTHRLLNVDHYPLAHARADGSTDAHDLHNAGFGQFAHHSANFCRANVEAYNELGLVHTSPLHP